MIYLKNRCASSIQATWRMKVAKEEFRSLRVHMLAAMEIQRCFRGFTGEIDGEIDGGVVRVGRLVRYWPALQCSTVQCSVACYYIMQHSVVHRSYIMILILIKYHKVLRFNTAGRCTRLTSTSLSIIPSGRKVMRRRRKWEAATPGPERIQLGLQMIDESKVCMRIDMMHVHLLSVFVCIILSLIILFCSCFSLFYFYFFPLFSPSPFCPSSSSSFSPNSAFNLLILPPLLLILVLLPFIIFFSSSHNSSGSVWATAAGDRCSA